jgi:PKD domain-containing protein
MRIARIHKRPRPQGRPNFEDTMIARVQRDYQGTRFAAVVALCVLLGSGGCSTDKVTVPGLSGPSELGLSLRLDATPDVLTADGSSTSAIQATVRDQNGQPKAGQGIFFLVTDSTGTAADIGGLNHPTAVSGPDGTAQVVYTSPFRTDFTANGAVVVRARPIGTDVNSEIYREVRIELHSAEGRLFPPKDGNQSPTCAIVVQAPFGFLINQSILFQTQASDPDGFIVRYFWTFGDSSNPSDKPDVEHHYSTHGTYSVTQTVTDNNGAQQTCSRDIRICDVGSAPCDQPPAP